jgi:hypothetical protein
MKTVCSTVHRVLAFSGALRHSKEGKMPLIVLDSATFNRVATYADTANLSIDTAIVQIINEWMDTTGDLILAEVVSDKQHIKRCILTT